MAACMFMRGNNRQIPEHLPESRDIVHINFLFGMQSATKLTTAVYNGLSCSMLLSLKLCITTRKEDLFNSICVLKF